MSTSTTACAQEPQTTADTQVQQLVAKARAAQAAFESFSQEQVDAIVKGIGKYVYDNAEMLARMAVDETGIGVYEDKILKNKGKARVDLEQPEGQEVARHHRRGRRTDLVFVAKPMGVVGAVTPVTNPIVTPMCNGMFALKTGNAVIFAPHPKAEKCTVHLTQEFMKIVKAHGGPDNLVQTVVERLGRDDAGADEGRGRRRGHRRRRDGEVGLLLGQAVVRRRRRERAGHHRSRRRPQGSHREDRHRRVVRQRHHLLARAVRASLPRSSTTRSWSRSKRPAKCGSPRTRRSSRSSATWCSPAGT